MTLAFNLTLPRGRRWWPLFLLGNLTIFGTPNFLRLPIGTEPPVLEAPAALAREASGKERFRVELAGPWFPSEQSTADAWRWAGGDVEIVVHNPHPFAIAAALRFGLNSRNERPVAVVIAGQERWRGLSTPARQEVVLESLVLPPGETRILLRSDRPAESTNEGNDPRPLAFRVLDLKLRVLQPIPER